MDEAEAPGEGEADHGLQVKSFVHDGQVDDAYWDGTKAAFGDGDIKYYAMSDGFTQFHSKLSWEYESGGLSESFADIAGTTAEFYAEGNSADWTIGTDISRRGTPIRFMCNPSQDTHSIENYADYTDELNGHFSSGISNKAFC